MIHPDLEYYDRRSDFFHKRIMSSIYILLKRTNYYKNHPSDAYDYTVFGIINDYKNIICNKMIINWIKNESK